MAQLRGAAARRFEATFGRRPAVGCWIGLPSPFSAEIMGLAGFDFALIDLEHGPGGFETAGAQMMALAAAGRTAPIVRVADASPARIKRALDLGAQAVMLPQIETPEQAAAAARAARYGPDGARGVATRIVRAARYGADEDYEARWNETGVVIAQIESPDALAGAGEIAAVEGVDALFFGPADYAAAAGYPGAAEVERAFAALTEAARGAGKAIGTVTFAGAAAADLVARGVDLVSVASDVSLLRRGAEQALKAARGG